MRLQGGSRQISSQICNLSIQIGQKIFATWTSTYIYITLHHFAFDLHMFKRSRVAVVLPPQDKLEKDYRLLLQDCEAHKGRATLYLGCEALGSKKSIVLSCFVCSHAFTYIHRYIYIHGIVTLLVTYIFYICIYVHVNVWFVVVWDVLVWTLLPHQYHVCRLLCSARFNAPILPRAAPNQSELLSVPA